MHFPKERKNVSCLIILRTTLCANSQFRRIIFLRSTLARIVLPQWSNTMSGSVAISGRRVGSSSSTNKTEAFFGANRWHRTCEVFFAQIFCAHDSFLRRILRNSFCAKRWWICANAKLIGMVNDVDLEKYIPPWSCRVLYGNIYARIHKFTEF